MINIVKGSDPRLVVVLQQKDDCGTVMPLNITPTMVISCVYRDLIGTKTKTSQTTAVEIIEPVYGKVFINFTDADTEKFRIGNFDFDIHVDDGPTKLIWKFSGLITIVDRIR